MAAPFKIGFIGLDTSHVVAFAKLLHETDNEFHVPGGQVTVAFPGGSPDFELSISRVDGFVEQLRSKYGVEMLGSPEQVAEASDVVFIESVDGRVHLAQLKAIAKYGKPVFIDKPFAVNMAEAREMAELAQSAGIPLMSSSSLRYAEGLTEKLKDDSLGAVIGADCYGPMALEATQPGLFWYGIHAVEMLYTILGPGCRSVRAERQADHEVFTGVWADGRIGTVRGNRKGNNQFGALIHRAKGSQFADIPAQRKPMYASLLESVMDMFRTGQPTISMSDTLEIIRFIEAANESRESGEAVLL